MKEFLRFIIWQWNKSEFWQKVFIIITIFTILSIAVPPPYSTYIVMASLSVVYCFICKWWIWDRLILAYKEFKKEKLDLFETIKTSDTK